jgi:hypothetical protein
MGRNKIQAKSDIQFELSRMMVPRNFLEFFEIVEVKELHNEWQIVLHEKAELIPRNLHVFSDIVLDGFCNPLHLLSHCFTLKPVMLVMKRRRWKRSNSDEHFSNEYTLTNDSSKLTPDMADFLKI